MPILSKKWAKSEQKVEKKCRSGGGGGGAAGGGAGGVCLAYNRGLVANTACEIKGFIWK